MDFKNDWAGCRVGSFALIAALAASGTLSSAYGQGWLPADATMFDKVGTVAGAPRLNVIPMITKNKAKWLIQVMWGQSQVKVTGTAAATYLHAGLFVKFTGEIDAAGALKNELKELEIFTPASKNSIGVFPSGADANTKPIGKVVAGTYEFRGKVIGYQNGELQVAAGKKITVKVASDAKIAVNVQDFSLAGEDDALAVKGWFYKGSSPAKGKPGQALGKMIEITLSKPLTTAPQKGPVKPLATKLAPKPKLPLEPKEPDDKPPVVASEPSAPAVVPDPFGFDKEDGKK